MGGKGAAQGGRLALVTTLSYIPLSLSIHSADVAYSTGSAVFQNTVYMLGSYPLGHTTRVCSKISHRGCGVESIRPFMLLLYCSMV